MPSFKIFRPKYVLVGFMTLITLPGFARIPIRPTSDNGVSSGSDSWTLLGRGVQLGLTANGKAIKYTRQVICPNQDRVNGSCLDNNGSGSGDYLFLFQIQSTSTNVSVNIGRLQGFVKVDGDHVGTYGVMICDDSLNDQELCTTDPDDPNYSKISAITFKVVNKTSVSFFVPSFPDFPAGSTQQEGRGLTFFIKTHQNAALPIATPSIGIK